MNVKKLAMPVAAAVIFLFCMILTEQTFAPPYAVKSAVKLVLIVLLVCIGTKLSGVSIKDGIRFHKMQRPAPLIAVSIAVIPVVLLGFFLLRNQLDLPAIREGLMAKEQLTKQNCLFVFAYIALCNSFLEEAFFRGFLTERFREAGLKKYGGWLSALCFALYHIGIVDSWLSPPMLILCIVMLFNAALFLQWICDRFGSVRASWLVHGCANLAINSVGILLIYFL
ncbi:MAG: CPBP family intramembrane metalloprotease [Oscillospiraceae bacterium]|nr:CPBP family intramembrane metalloprotease [Oscillospiraceae bacterium]